MKLQTRNKLITGFPLLKLSKICLDQDNIAILKEINLEIKSSEVHALVGEHGSGKTSLAYIISGMLKPDSGNIYFNNKMYNYLNVNHAKKLNIVMVFQQIYLLDYFTVAENILIPDKITHSFPFLSKKQIFQEAKILLESNGFKIDPHILVKDLQLSDKMVIHILRSIYRKPDLLILDSVLEKLASSDLELVKGLLIKLKNQGTAMLYITNRIDDDIYDIADKVTIIRNGQILLTDAVRNIDRINLIKLCYAQITKSRESENLNQEFYQLLKYNEAILQKLPINLIVTDNQNKIKMINEFGIIYFYLENSQYLNLPLDDLFGKKNKEALKLIKSALAEKQEKAYFSVPLTVKDSKNITNIKTFPIYDGAFLIGNIIIIEDISKQENLRQQVILSEKLASVGLLAAGVAHEINNPLEIIYNYLNFLKFNINKDSIQKTVKNLEEEIAYIKQIVGNLISFSDSNKITNEDFNVNDLIRSLLDLIKYNAKHKRISIKYFPSDSQIMIKAGKNEIKQVILNLIKNSFEAMPDGGIINIETCITETGNSKFANIIIRDTGPGIKDENLHNIFLPFYSTKKGSGQNLGLGLSVSYGIIKKYNGEINIDNMKGLGCEFKIVLPL